jgi:hypothetical protein
MKIALRLLVGVFGLLLLAGCGGGSGSSGGGETPTIENSFPELRAVNGATNSAGVVNGILEPIYAHRSLVHWYVPSGYTQDFEAFIRQQQYSLASSGSYIKSIPHSDGITYDATVSILNPIGADTTYQIMLRLDNANGDVAVGLFDEIYGEIDGKFARISLHHTYSGDQTDVFRTYETLLQAEGFELTSSNHWEKREGKISYAFLWSIVSSLSGASWHIEDNN